MAKEMIINGKNVAEGIVVKALTAMLDGADDTTLRNLKCYKANDTFYRIQSEVMSFNYLAHKVFNAIVIYTTYCDSFEFRGDEVDMERIHPLCIINKDLQGDTRADVCLDIVNGLIRQNVFGSKAEYINSYDEQ